MASVLFTAVGVFIAVSRLPEILIYAAVLAQWNPANQDPATPFSQRLVPVTALGGSLVVILVGAGLILLRDRLADRLFSPGTQPLSAREVQAVAYSVLGCYFAVQGLSGISRFGWSGQLDWAGATQLVLGVALFFGARGLSRLWSLSRSTGT